MTIAKNLIEMFGSKKYGWLFYLEIGEQDLLEL